jgi:hypothetical protein
MDGLIHEEDESRWRAPPNQSLLPMTPLSGNFQGPKGGSSLTYGRNVVTAPTSPNVSSR